MEIKIFISYFDDDNKKMLMLKNLIESTESLTPIVIADRRKSLEPLTIKVENGIKESQIIVPILTKQSISSQWVNQEIGYAYALESIKIMPIIETSIMDKLKGFIHKQVDLSHNFQSFPDNPRKESLRFRKCILSLLSEIKRDYNISTNSEEDKEKNDGNNENKFFKDGHFDNLKILKPEVQLRTSLHPFIKNPSGILSFWAKVTGHHNLIKDKKRYLYITSYFSSNKMDALNIARYPNMWAILRETPTIQNEYGSWSFICNGIENKRTKITYNNELKKGWHLFSVEWSMQMDFIKFYIDKNLVGEKIFENWPEDFKSSMFIGTWPNKDPNHQFYSDISTPYFAGEIDSRILNEIFNHKPDEN
jgi:hypothetical protein